jgi:hypothetical protein
MGAAKTVTRAGHDGDASVKPDCHELSPVFFLPSSLAGEGGSHRKMRAG